MTPHLKLTPGDISPYVIVCGDPARAEQIAARCCEHKELAWNREYRTFEGCFNGEKIAITSHGVGSAGAAIAFEELIKLGARVIIRVGTCGSLTEKLRQGSHIIASAAVREDGVSRLLVPEGYPAVADAHVTDALETAAQTYGSSYMRGLMLTSDCFYGGVLPQSLELYSRANVVGVEMEVATLFVIALLRGIKAGALATVDGSPLKWDKGDYDPHGTAVSEGKDRMLTIGLAALAQLAKERA